MNEENKESIIKATHEGILKLANTELKCYVLSDGRRVLNQRTLANAFNITSQGGNVFMRSMKSKSIGSELTDILKEKLYNPLKIKSKRGDLANCIEAEFLVDICSVIIDANKKGKLSSRQINIATQAEVLLRSIAKVGITALVDEATGYQEVRRKGALQELLDKYLLKEYAKWAKRFPDEFYIELFRLLGWDWENFKIKKPSYLGKVTKDIVYSRLAPGILEELEKINPKDEKGRRKVKHHQFLTEDIGHQALHDHLTKIITLMKICDNYRSFYPKLQRVLPVLNEQMLLDLE